MPSSSRSPREVRREPRVAEHDRHDRVDAGLDREARPPSSARGRRARSPSAGRAARSTPRGARATASDAPTIDGRERVREQVGPRALAQQVDDLARPAVKPPAAPPSALPSVEVRMSTRPMHAAVLGRARGRSCRRSPMACESSTITSASYFSARSQIAVELREVAVHREDAVGGDHPQRACPASPSARASSSAMSPLA